MGAVDRGHAVRGARCERKPKDRDRNLEGAEGSFNFSASLLCVSLASNKPGGSGEREKGGKPNARTQLSNSQPDPTPDHTSLHRQNRTISRDRTSSLSRKANNQRPRSHRTRNTQRLAPRRRVNAPTRQRTPRDRRSRRRRSRCPAPDDYRRRDGTPQDRPRTTR